MPSPQGPLLPRRRLGAELRRLRGDRTLDEVAAETLISTSKLSRLENGQGVPQPRDIRDLINFYGADRPTADRLRRWMNEGRRQAWWREYSDVLTESADVFLDYESGASVIRTYVPMILPGLLQTEAYATQHLTMTLLPATRTPEEVKKLVQVRLRRQEILLERRHARTRLLAVIDEAAVLRAHAMGSPRRGRRASLFTSARSPDAAMSPFAFCPSMPAFMPDDRPLHDLISSPTTSTATSFISRPIPATGILEEQSSVLEYLRLFDARRLTSAATRQRQEVPQTLT